MPDNPPFHRSDYVLEPGAAGAGIALKRTTQADADMCGPAITGMEPWARLGLSAEQMIGFLAGSNEILALLLDLARRGSRRSGCRAFPWLSGPYLNLLGGASCLPA